MAVPETVLKVYSAYRKGKIGTPDVMKVLNEALTKKDHETLYRLSRLVYANGDEYEKRELSKKLLLHGLMDLVPFRYQKDFKNMPR